MNNAIINRTVRNKKRIQDLLVKVENLKNQMTTLENAAKHNGRGRIVIECFNTTKLAEVE